MNYKGDFAEDATVYIEFNTFTSDDPSASATITDLVDADIKVHKDGNATEIVTDGATVIINFDGVTGNHLITIDTSVDAAYSTGSDYLVRINGTTVDGAIINAWVGSFSIENRFMRGTDSALLAASVNIADGAIESDLTHIGGNTISGNNATLKLKQFDITNNTGTAFVCKSTGSNGHGMDIGGNGTGEGLKATGGATGHGIDAQGGASGGQGLNAKANGGNGAGVLFQGEGTGEGLDARGGITGHGLSGRGGATSGAGIFGQAQANNDAGMELVKHGTGKDLDADTIAADTAAIQGKLPTNKFMGSSDGADDDGTLNTIAGDVVNIDGIVPAAVGDAMTLAADAIKKVTYDESTAWPLLAADVAATQIARVGADGDTLETLSDEIAVVKAETALIVADTNELQTDDVPTLIAAVPTVDEIWAKAMQDLGAIPGATASVLDAINILFMALRNKQTATDGAQTIRNNAGATIATATLSDAAGTTTKEKYA